MKENVFEYYYNNVPHKGLCRNNLIYTSLISSDRKTFCQWFYNDTEYHRLKNKVVKPELMQEKWEREVSFLEKMQTHYPNHVPVVEDIDYKNKKIYYQIDGYDIWEQNGCTGETYEKVTADWKEQILEILGCYRKLGIYKYSLHPSSYFIVHGKIKSINHFFCYTDEDSPISISDIESHISEERLDMLKDYLAKNNISYYTKQTFNTIQEIALNSFRTNFSDDFIADAKKVMLADL